MDIYPIFSTFAVEMRSLEPFKIDLKGLKDDLNDLTFSLDNDFFEALDAPLVRYGNLDCRLTLRKSVTFFECYIRVKGTVTVQCDRCLDDMQQPIDADSRFVVKFGAERSEDDDMIILTESDPVLDTSWLIYELIVLNIPIRHVHAPGKCNRAMVKMLEEHSVDRSLGEEDDELVDSRWAALKGLKLD